MTNATPRGINERAPQDGNLATLCTESFGVKPCTTETISRQAATMGRPIRTVEHRHLDCLDSVAHRAPKPMTATRLASEMGRTHDSARHLLDRLVASSLLTKTRGKPALYSMTDQGLELLDTVPAGTFPPRRTP